jgi:hypothetical protein
MTYRPVGVTTPTQLQSVDVAYRTAAAISITIASRFGR